MLKSITTLEESLISKKKYIWDINRDSLLVFTLLAFRSIKIDGFVSVGRKHIGEQFLNTEVISVDELQKQKDAVLIVSDKCRKYGENKILAPGSYVKMRFLSELLTFNWELTHQKVLICGINPVGSEIKELLEKAGAEVTAFLTLDRNTFEPYEGKPVILLDRLPEQQDYAEYAVVLAESNTDLRNLIADFMDKIGLKSIYFIDEWVDNTLMKQSNLFLFIDQAFKKNKSIYLTGKGTAFASHIEKILELYSVPIAGYISEEETENVRSIYDLYYEGIKSAFVIITAAERLKTEEIGNKLEKIGLSVNNYDYVGIYPVQWKGHPFVCNDSLVDFSRNMEKGLPGVKVIGHGGRKIIILGGSTSTCDSFKPKSWVEFFYEKIKERTGDVTIYNMAHEGNDVVIELLRLLRDGYALKPDYVISMSGVNNTTKREDVANQFNTVMPVKWLRALDPKAEVLSGIQAVESNFSFWRRIEQVIKVVSELYGAAYLGFLQPMNVYKPHKSLFDTMMMEDEETRSEKSFMDESLSDDFYINLQDMFWAKEGMYIDNCHYTTLGNERLADAVAEAFWRQQVGEMLS